MNPLRHAKARIRYGGLTFNTNTTTKEPTPKATKESAKSKAIAYDSSKLLAVEPFHMSTLLGSLIASKRQIT
ncbi:hypothetical protein [Desulfosporosinus fructosivorans]